MFQEILKKGQKVKIVIAGGGTAGHVAPLLAIVEELEAKEQKTDIVFVGSKNGVEKKIIPQTGIRMLTIRCGKFRRYHKNSILNIVDPTTIVKNILDFKNFIAGIFDSLRILKEEDPDVVFLKGGYVTLPLGIACRIKGFPYFIHESDVVPGMANRILLKKAQKVFVSYPIKNFKGIPEEKLIYSGNPVRKDVIAGDREKAYEKFGLDKGTKTILVIGGSQGAHTINVLISEKMKEYAEKYQVIHISGDYDYDWLEREVKKNGSEKEYKLFNFLSGDLKDAYAVSDIVVTRAGNNVLTEVAALSKPTIIIPLESSANDHQLENAKAFSREGAAYVMMQAHLAPEKLFKQIDTLLNNPEETAFLSEKIHSFYKENASKIVADHLVNFYKKILREEERKDATKRNKVKKTREE